MPDSGYPIRLIPKRYYLLLDCTSGIIQGDLLRWIKMSAEYDSQGMLLAKSLELPQSDHLIRHCSVNLLGNFKIVDAAWQSSILKDGPRAEEFDKPWRPGEKGLLPKKEEAQKDSDSIWGYFCWNLELLHGQLFSVGNDNYACYVIHKPTKRNYWHFELHFENELGQDLQNLYNDKKLSKSKVRGIISGIRAKLIDATKRKGEICSESDWPVYLYSGQTFAQEGWWQIFMKWFKDL